MGGSSSGRYRTRTRGCVEATARIDLRKLNGLGVLNEGQAMGAVFDYGPNRVLRVQAHLTDEDDRHLRVRLNEEATFARVRLDAVPMRYGGFRYYAICPRTGRRCEVLPVIKGVIACRQFHRLSYASQHRDPLTACHRAIERQKRRLVGARRKNRQRQQTRLAAANTRLGDKVAAFDCAILRKYRAHLPA